MYYSYTIASIIMLSKIKTNKKGLLAQFLEDHKDLPAQRSIQWLLDRMYCIGGSEIETVIGLNWHKTALEMLRARIGLDPPFTGNINTYWGTVLEDVVVAIMEKMWDCKIAETGSLPGAVPGQKYSPDGLVYLEHLDALILLEIKTASRRYATNTVPRCYMPQILTGLDSIPMTDYAIFIDATLRKCSFADFAFTPEFDHDIHPPKVLKHNPIMLCLLTFVDPKGSSNSTRSEPFEEIMRKVASDEYTRIMSPLIYPGDDIEAAVAAVKRKPHVLILPVKIFGIKTIRVDRDDWHEFIDKSKLTATEEQKKGRFIDMFADIIAEFVANVHLFDDIPQDKREAAFSKLFVCPEIDDLVDTDSESESEPSSSLDRQPQNITYDDVDTDSESDIGQAPQFRCFPRRVSQVSNSVDKISDVLCYFDNDVDTDSD